RFGSRTRHSLENAYHLPVASSLMAMSSACRRPFASSGRCRCSSFGSYVERSIGSGLSVHRPGTSPTNGSSALAGTPSPVESWDRREGERVRTAKALIRRAPRAVRIVGWLLLIIYGQALLSLLIATAKGGPHGSLVIGILNLSISLVLGWALLRGYRWAYIP